MSKALPVHLTVVPVGEVAAERLERMAGKLAQRFPLEWRVHPPLRARSEWNAGDGRLRSSAVLDALVGLPASDAAGPAAPSHERKLWMLAVADADLAAPRRPFVFGEAEVAGCCAVVGTARLEAGAGGELAGERLLKEAVHELGHVAGLAHCPDTRCAMHPSADVGEVDHKDADLCSPCAEALRNLLGSAGA